MAPLSLLYHDVVESGGSSSSGLNIPGAAQYKLECSAFERHLAAIARAPRSRPVTLTDLTQLDAGTRPILLTFDDGGVSAYERTADMLEARGWRGHFFVITDCIGSPGFLDARQIRALRRRGHVIGSHSCSHPVPITACAPAQLEHEWRESIRVLAEILGEPVDTASVPGGYYSRRVAEAAAAAGIRALFSSEPTTRVAEVSGCRILGRYMVRRGDAPELAGALAAGALAPRLRQALSWNLKKAAKAALGKHWLEIRRRLLDRRARRAD